MAVCKNRRFPRQKLCAGDLRHKIEIVKRTHVEPEPGQTVGRNTFLLIKRTRAALKTSTSMFGGTARFDSVNIENRITHTFTIRHSNSFKLIETSNHFIRFNGRYFRILRSSIVDEDSRMIDIPCTERGIENFEANEA